MSTNRGRLCFLVCPQGLLVSSDPPLSFTLSQLEYFIATLESGSFTAAAETLGVSQPAVAEQIQRLERSVGRSLFARRARGVAPTGAARDLEPHARRVLDSSREAMAAMTAANSVDAGFVALGTFASPHHYDIAALIEEFLADNPGARVRIEGRNSSSTADAVRTGSLDAAVIALPVAESGLDVRPIFEGEVFYVSADPERARRPVTIAEVAERPFIVYESSSGTSDPTRAQLAARAQAAGVHILPRIEVESYDVAVELAAAGLGDTYVPRIVIRSIDSRLHVTSFDPPLFDTIALITRTGARLARPVADFVERLTSHVVSLIGDGVNLD